MRAVLRTPGFDRDATDRDLVLGRPRRGACIELAERLREYRLRRGAALAEVAGAAGIESLRLALYEHGLATPQPRTLQRLCRVFGVSPEPLLRLRLARTAPLQAKRGRP